jgi:hypothetical protein
MEEGIPRSEYMSWNVRAALLYSLEISLTTAYAIPSHHENIVSTLL